METAYIVETVIEIIKEILEGRRNEKVEVIPASKLLVDLWINVRSITNNVPCIEVIELVSRLSAELGVEVLDEVVREWRTVWDIVLHVQSELETT